MQVSKYGRGIALTPQQTADTYDSKDFKDVPYLDSMAVYNPDQNEVVIFAENKGEQAMDFTTTLNGFNVDHLEAATQFCGYDIKQTNEDQTMKIQPHDHVNVTDGVLKTQLEPLSWNMFRVSVIA